MLNTEATDALRQPREGKGFYCKSFPKNGVKEMKHFQ